MEWSIALEAIGRAATYNKTTKRYLRDLSQRPSWRILKPGERTHVEKNAKRQLNIGM